MKYSLLVSILLFFSQSITYAAYFRSYQVEDGLSHNSVWTVMQDSQGFVWFGTIDGLNRFDGKSFKIYRKKQGDSSSIGNNFIHCLKEISQNRLLVGTKEGLYLYNRDFENFKHIKLSQNGKEASINYIMEDPDGNIWVACNGQGLYALHSDLSIKKQYKSDTNKQGIFSNYIWCIAQDYNGDIWLGSADEGLIFFDPKRETFMKIKDNPQLGITDKTIFSLFCDIDNNIWIGTLSEGLYRYNYRNGKVNNYLKGRAFSIKSIIDYSDHELIMGSDKGLLLFNRNLEVPDFINEDSSFDNLTDKSIFSIIRDKEGAFWIGTYFGGVNYYSPTINKFVYYGSSNNLSTKNIISSFAEDSNNNIWVGTHNDGLSVFDSKKTAFRSRPYNIGYHDVQALLLDNEKLFVSLYGQGISMVNVHTGAIAKIPQNQSINTTITSMFRSSTGTILFGSEDGVSYIDPSSNSLQKIDRLTGIPIKGITEDYKGALWFASHANGLLRLNADGTWDVFKHDPKDPASLNENNVNCVFQDAKFRIWVGTEGGGLALFNNQKNKFDIIFDEESGLPSNIIYAILDDTDGNIWVTTGGGLVRIDANLQSTKTISYIGDLQKIRYNLRCALRASDNKLYFGGTNGFIAFNPKEITDNLQKPAILFTGFRLFNHEVIPGEPDSPLNISIAKTKEITLKHYQSSFGFDFVSLSFLSPMHNQYAYQLDGFDENWTYTTENKASYMNIPPGEYVFRVKGSNNDGIWSDTEVSIIIKIKPPVWLTTWMIALYIIFVLGTSAYLIYRYNRHLIRKNQEKLYKYQTEKEKEIYESKINFFTNIAHEIRTPLSLIVAPLENIILSNDGNAKTKNNLGIIKHNANRLLELINQLLDFRKVEDNMFHFNFKKQDIVKIVQDVYNQYSQHAQLSGISISLRAESNPILCTIDSEAIYKIASNLVSNAVKYAKSKIEIRIETKENNLYLSVKDDGIGLDKNYQEKVFEPFFQVQDNDNYLRTGSGLGLSLSQSLALKHNGKITIESEYASGSLFMLCIPITSNNESVTSEEKEQDSFNSDLALEENLQLSDSGLRILIVEDNNELRSFISDSLSESFKVFEAENGKKALEIIDKEAIDVIISDIIMPEMDGMELCNAIKSNTAYSHIPLILLSAKTDTPTKIEGLKKGADVYLEKPFSVEQLKAQINSIIENRNNIRNNFIQSPLHYFKQNTENTENADFIEKLNESIIEHMSDEKFSIDNLSELFHISRSNFHKKIKSITGMTPNDYIKLIRLNKSAQMLSTGKYKVNEVCYLVGFNTPSYFSKCFFDQFGKLPKDFVQDISE